MPGFIGAPRARRVARNAALGSSPGSSADATAGKSPRHGGVARIRGASTPAGDHSRDHIGIGSKPWRSRSPVSQFTVRSSWNWRGSSPSTGSASLPLGCSTPTPTDAASFARSGRPRGDHTLPPRLPSRTPGAPLHADPGVAVATPGCRRRVNPQASPECPEPNFEAQFGVRSGRRATTNAASTQTRRRTREGVGAADAWVRERGRRLAYRRQHGRGDRRCERGSRARVRHSDRDAMTSVKTTVTTFRVAASLGWASSRSPQVSQNPDEQTTERSRHRGRMGAAELPHGLVDAFGLLEVADVTAIGNHNQVRGGNRVLELARDAER